MKFVLFVEGDTEQRVLPTFIKRWLDPQLSKSAGVQTVKFTGWSELVKQLVNRANAHLNSPGSADIIAVISLLDLYGPGFYPANKTTADERYAWAKAELEGRVGHPKFRQHFAVHELEAWLLSQPDIFPQEVRQFVQRAAPEQVNFTEPPKSLLKKLYRAHRRENYKEVTHGVALFAKLNPGVALGKCPRLRAMLDDMLNLARQAGIGGGANA
jgi:hypothetical protein